MAEYWKSITRGFHRNPVLNGLAVVAMGMGIGASMTMLITWRVMSADPLPARSDRLFYPHLDPLPLNYHPSPDQVDPSTNLTWTDAMALLKAARGRRQAAMAGGTVLLQPADSRARPFHVEAHYVTRDFFAMFGIPMVSGMPWAEADDDGHARAVVLSAGLAQQLFGAAIAVGRDVNLDHHDYRVIGVSSDWAPEPKFYVDASESHFDTPDRLYLPLSTALDRDLSFGGNLTSWGNKRVVDRRVDDASWLQFWVELDSVAQVADYRHFLYDYAEQQHVLGRFQRSPQLTRLDSLMSHLRQLGMVPGDVRLQLALALAFQGVCLLNITAMLLAMYLRRSGEISIRRALGASRQAIFSQLAAESAGIGLLGGMLGLLLAELGVWIIRQQPDDYARLVHMDVGSLGVAMVLAVGCSLLAGLIPAWRACTITPALQLKAE